MIYEWIPPSSFLEQGTSAPIKCPLGCAAWGCVFELTNGKVLKVTSDDDEITAVNLFIKMRNEGVELGGIVELFSKPVKIAPFPWKDRTRSSIYMYEREAVIPLMDENTDRYDFDLPKYPRVEPTRLQRTYSDVEDKRHDAIYLLNEVGTDIVQNRINPFIKQTKAKRVKKEKLLIVEYLKWFDVLDNDQFKANIDITPIVFSLHEFVEFVDEEYVLFDVGPNNMGTTKSGVLKLFDFQILKVD